MRLVSLLLLLIVEVRLDIAEYTVGVADDQAAANFPAQEKTCVFRGAFEWACCYTRRVPCRALVITVNVGLKYSLSNAEKVHATVIFRADGRVDHEAHQSLHFTGQPSIKHAFIRVPFAISIRQLTVECSGAEPCSPLGRTSPNRKHHVSSSASGQQ